MNQLVFEEVTKVYGQKRANDGISMTLENGVYGLLGPNGAGKSTLMKQLCLLTKSTSGVIKYNGKRVKVRDTKFLENIGYLPQSFGVYNNFTAKDFLMYMAKLKGMRKGEAKERVNQLLEMVNLSDVKNKKVSGFSGGMKQRVGIAQALLNDPKILILDEPTAGLDPKERARFRKIISDISKDKIIIFSTHIISDVEAISRETIMIKEGKIILKGDQDHILANMRGKVFEKDIQGEREGRDIEDRYKVVNLQRRMDGTRIRFIAEAATEALKGYEVEPSFEDVYMFYFDKEEEA